MKATRDRSATGLSRRQFLHRTALGGTALLGFSIMPGWGGVSPNEKLNLGVIGVAGRGDNLRGVAGENIVALCDVDDQRLSAAAQQFPGAKVYNDFRRLVDRKDLDAIVVSTPDHTHAVATAAVLRSGRHAYCEKPLTHTVSEARFITELAQKNPKLVTQIGTQIHAERNYRRVVELIQANAIGTVREVHVWAAAVYGGKNAPTERPPVPAHIHYDLWLGPVEERPYSPEYVPFAWRNWWAFGGGSLADFGCHFMDLPFWALDLAHPLAVEPVEGPPVHPDSTPPWLVMRYDFPARGAKPPVKLTWYHGGKYPSLITPERFKEWKSGVLFVGEKGQLLSNYSQHLLLPEADFAGFKAPAPTIPNSIGHHQEWIRACKTGQPTTCHFGYSGPLSETALLGNVAYRVGQKLEWDWKKLKAANCPAAEKYIQHHYRKGWQL